MTIHVHTKLLRIAATVLLSVIAAGCSSSSDQPQVASLPTTTIAIAPTVTRHSTSVSTSTSTSTGSRPRERLDESPAQDEALYAPWNECLDTHGAGKADRPTQSAETAAQAACAYLKPLPPWQLDPANPKALGFVQHIVACLHQHGVRYAQVKLGDGWGYELGGPQNDQTSINKGLQLGPTCDQQAQREDPSASTSP